MTARDPIPALCVERLTKSYGGRRAIRSVDFEVRPGDLVALVGTNGAGKTTLLKCVLDLMLPDAGRVEIFGVPNREPHSRRRVAYLLSEVEAWCASRPVSQLPPPPNTGRRKTIPSAVRAVLDGQTAA